MSNLIANWYLKTEYTPINKIMDLSFQSTIDCLLNIVKNSTLEQEAKLNNIKMLETGNNSKYLILNITTDKIGFDITLGLSENKKTYSVCGTNIEISMLNKYCVGAVWYRLINRCCEALASFIYGISFYQSEVFLCLK